MTRERRQWRVGNPAGRRPGQGCPVVLVAVVFKPETRGRGSIQNGSELVSCSSVRGEDALLSLLLLLRRSRRGRGSRWRRSLLRRVVGRRRLLSILRPLHVPSPFRPALLLLPLLRLLQLEPGLSREGRGLSGGVGHPGVLRLRDLSPHGLHFNVAAAQPPATTSLGAEDPRTTFQEVTKIPSPALRRRSWRLRHVLDGEERERKMRNADARPSLSLTLRM